MGLDGVEIVMKVEEVFGIAIEDAEAEAARTPGDLIRLIMAKVELSDRTKCRTQQAFHRLRAVLMRELKLKRSEIRTETSLNSLFTPATRKETFRKVLNQIGVEREVEFSRSLWLKRLIGAATFVIGLTSVSLLVMHAGYASGISYLTAALISLAFLGLMLFITRPWIREFHMPLMNVADLVSWLVINGFAPEIEPKRWSRAEIGATVRTIVLDVLDCEKQYCEEASFVNDLGLS